MEEENTGSNETSGPEAHLIGMGKDEMNLAEFPLTTLADRVPQGCKTLVFEDCIFDKGQRQHVTRRLTISAADKYGLPTALDDEVILGLVQLSKADDFTNRQVQFSRYQLVHLLGWREEGKSYARLEESLKRWLGVTLYYENAWWDKCRKKWVDAHFHLLDNLLLYHRGKRGGRSAKDDEGKPLSSFVWNEVIYRSFQAGYLKKLDLEFHHTLKSAVSKRIYRFLDKRFYRRHKWRFRLVQFAREHIGLSRRYDTAQLKRRLNPAIVELEQAGFLTRLPLKERFRQLRRGEWEVVFVRAPKAQEPRRPMAPWSDLENRLIDRGVTATSAVRLVREHPADVINAKLAVFDALRRAGDRRVSRNPPGYLVKSIREDYVPPVGLLVKACQSSSESAVVVKDIARDRAQRRAKELRVSESDRRIDQYLASLSAEERSELESVAVAKARGFPANGLRRSIALRKESIAAHYRQVIVRQHVERLLDQQGAA